MNYYKLLLLNTIVLSSNVQYVYNVSPTNIHQFHKQQFH